MDIRIDLTEAKRQRIAEAHGEGVLQALEETVSKKNETLQWKSSVEACAKRFRVYKAHAGEHFVELSFSVNRGDYRAVLGWVERHNVFIVLSVFDKADHYQSSKQHAVFNQLHRNPQEVMEDAVTRYEEALLAQ